EYAPRACRQTQQGDQCGSRRSPDEGADRRLRLHGVCKLARRLRHVHRRIYREVGQGDQVLRCQGVLIRGRPAGYSISPVPRIAGDAVSQTSVFENAEIGGARLSDTCTTGASALQHPDTGFVSFGSSAPAPSRGAGRLVARVTRTEGTVSSA